MESNKKYCKNCHHEVHGNYCIHCGQQTKVHRINFHLISHGLLHGIAHFDKGFLYTAKELNSRPGHTIREYFEGKRVSHANPLFMLLILGGILSYVYYHFAIKTLTSFNIAEIDQYSETLHFISSKYFSLTYIAFCFVFALLDSLFFNYKNYNYVEYFFLNIFIAIEIIFLNLLASPFFYYLKGTGFNVYLRLIIIVLFSIYFFIVRYQFFNLQHDKKGFKRLILEMFFYLAIVLVFGHTTVQSIFK